MIKINWENIWNTTQKYLPGILTGIGIGGFFTTTVLAVKATPEAERRIKDYSREIHDGDPYAYTKKEAFHAAWKCYIPAATTGVLSTVCLVAASSESARRNAALAAACSLSESTLKAYQEKMVQVLGEDKEREIREDVAAEQVQNAPTVKNSVYIVNGKDILFYEPETQQEFLSDVETVRSIQNNLNKRMLLENYIPFTDLLYELDLNRGTCSDDYGWNLDHGFVDITWEPTMLPSGRPGLKLIYKNRPRWDDGYSNL